MLVKSVTVDACMLILGRVSVGVRRKERKKERRKVGKKVRRTARNSYVRRSRLVRSPGARGRVGASHGLRTVAVDGGILVSSVESRA